MPKSLDYYSNKVRFNIERIKIEYNYLKHRSNSYMIKQKENGFITTLRSEDTESAGRVVTDFVNQFEGFSDSENAEIQSVGENEIRSSVSEQGDTYRREKQQRQERVVSPKIYNDDQLKLHVAKTRGSNIDNRLQKRQSYTSSNYSNDNNVNIMSNSDTNVKRSVSYRNFSNNLLPIIKKTGLKLLKIEPLPIQYSNEIEELEEACSGVKKSEKYAFESISPEKCDCNQCDIRNSNYIDLKITEKTEEKHAANPMSLTAARISIEKRVSSNMVREIAKDIVKPRVVSSATDSSRKEKRKQIEIDHKMNENDEVSLKSIEERVLNGAKIDDKNKSVNFKQLDQDSAQENDGDENKQNETINDTTKLKEAGTTTIRTDFTSVRKISVRSLNSEFINIAANNHIRKNTLIKSRPTTRASMDRTFESYGDFISDYANESFKENNA